MSEMSNTPINLAIQVRQLTKWYGPLLAVDHIDFEIPKGQIVGFLGPNGAGKSTTLRMITGYLPPTSGGVRIDGKDVMTDIHEARKRIGYMPESTPLYGEMKVREYLHFRGRLQGMSRKQRQQRIEELITRCGLTKVHRRLISALSKGNRQRVGLAQALMHRPPVLILDEPTAGLDPAQITEVRKLIDELRGDHTIILSTHILPEVERIADRIIVISSGQIVADGTVAELRNREKDRAQIVLEVQASEDALSRELLAIDQVESIGRDMLASEGWLRATLKGRLGCDEGKLRETIALRMGKMGWPIRLLQGEDASLERFFVRITTEQYQSDLVLDKNDKAETELSTAE